MPELDTGCGTLHYEVDEPLGPAVDGDGGAAVVFCHGVGTNCDTWTPWLAAVRERHRVVRFDTRGFGRSAEAADDGLWTMDRLADDILAVASAVGLHRFHLVGESLGGTVCLYLACRGDVDLASLTVASTAYRGDRVGAVQSWWGAIETNGMGPWSARMMTQRFVPGALSDADWQWFAGVQERTRPDSLLAAAQLLIDTDLSAKLPAIRLPVLILNSDGSPYVTPALAVDLQSRIEGAELCIFPGSRHGVVFSHGERCAEIWRDFVTRRAA